MTTNTDAAPSQTLDEQSATLQRVYDLVGMGALARTPGILLTNLENMRRRSDCLSGVEQLFTYDIPDEDYPGETTEDCDLNWGQDRAEYVETFKAALPAFIARHPELMQAEAVRVDDAFERALAELVNKIDTGLDSGDLLTDAKRASVAIDSILSGGDLVACAHEYFRDSGDRYEKSVEFRIGWNTCLDAIGNARAALAARSGDDTAQARRLALIEAEELCMRTTPDRSAVAAIGESAHYLACAMAIRKLRESGAAPASSTGDQGDA